MACSFKNRRQVGPKKQSLYLQTAKPCNNNNKVCVSPSRPSTKCYELVHRLTVPEWVRELRLEQTGNKLSGCSGYHVLPPSLCVTES